MIDEFKYVFFVCDVHKGRRHLFLACFLTNTLQAKKNTLQKHKCTKTKIRFIDLLKLFLLFLCDFLKFHTSIFLVIGFQMFWSGTFRTVFLSFSNNIRFSFLSDTASRTPPNRQLLVHKLSSSTQNWWFSSLEFCPQNLSKVPSSVGRISCRP